MSVILVLIAGIVSPASASLPQTEAPIGPITRDGGSAPNSPQPKSTAEARTSALAAVEAAAAQTGKARVIVSFDMAFAPEGALAPSELGDQKARIAAAEAAVNDVVTRSGGTVLREYAGLPFIAAEVPSAAVRPLRESSAVAMVRLDERRELTLTESTSMISANSASAAGFTGSGQTVAVIDSGVRTSHPFLAGRSRNDACFDSYEYSCPGGGSWSTGSGAGEPLSSSHGTHVTGIAVGNGGPGGMRGVAPGANYIPIRVFGASGSAYDSDILAALNYVYSLRYTTPIASVNLSLGGGAYTSQSSCDLDNPAYKSMFSQLVSAGIAPVVASGNDGYINALSAPACVSGAISVGATGDTDDEVQYFSNSAGFLTVFAPGANITSSVPSSGYGTATGTSMAAPHIAGSLAVMRQARQSDSVPTMLSRISRNSPTVCDPAAPGVCKPRVNLWRSLELARPGAPTQVWAAPGSAAATVYWQPPASDGGSPITGYTATARTTSNGSLAGTCTAPAAGGACTISNLANGTSYQVTVTATNAIGAGPASTAVSVTPAAPLTMPGAPAQVWAAPGSAAATAYWQPPASDGGSPITDYTAIARTTSNGSSAGTCTAPATRRSCTISNLANGTSYQVTVTATNAIGAGPASSAVSVTPAEPPAVAPSDYIPMAPVRLADTRASGAPVAAAGILQVQVAGQFGVPADVSAVSLNVTTVSPSNAGFVTVFPCGDQRPLASTLNYTSGSVVANAAIAKVGIDGTVCLFSSTATHLIVDANGYFPAGSDYTALVPVRAADTRNGTGGVPTGALGAGRVLEIPVAGTNGVPADASAASLNITAVYPSGYGFVTVFPCGQDRPTASTLNFTTGTIANAAIAQPGSDGKVCLYTSAATHLIVDVNGYFPAGSEYSALVPVRAADTRTGTGAVPTGPVAAGQVLQVQVAGTNGVPADASAVSLNVTAVSPSGYGFVTVFPCGQARPTASTLNFKAGGVVANAAVARAGQDGKVCLFTSAATQLIVDVNGYFPTS